MTSEFFHPLSHLLRLKKKLLRISLFPTKEVVRSLMDTVYISARSTILSYAPIVVQKRGSIVTPICLSALFKRYTRMHFTLFFFTEPVVSKLMEIPRTNLNSFRHFQSTLVCNYSGRILRCCCRWHFRYNYESCSGIRLRLSDNFSKH